MEEGNIYQSIENETVLIDLPSLGVGDQKTLIKLFTCND